MTSLDMALLPQERQRIIQWLSHKIERADAEDIYQEACLRAWRASAQYDGRSRWSTWFHRIVLNCLYDAYRLRRRRPDSYGWQELVEQHRISGDPVGAITQQQLRTALRRVDPKHRVPLMRVLRRGYRQAAADLRVPEGTVKSRASRGRRQLAAALGRVA